MFSRSSENHQGKVTSIGGEATCSQKAQNICEYWGEVGSLLVGITPEGKMLLTLLSNVMSKE